MTDPLEDIFSPERLRAHWQMPKAITTAREEPGTMPFVSENVKAVYNRLQALIHEQFRDKQGEALSPVMQELQDLLLKRFPPGAEVSEEDKATLNLSIEELLNSIEDLIEALEL